MNIFEKLAKARKTLKEKGLKMSGKNTYSNYEYFELSDFMPEVTKIEEELKILSVVNFGRDDAMLTVYNCEKPEESIVFTSPMSTAELKGCHPVQNLGAVETYVRRYLYNITYEIVECDALNKTQGKEDKTPNKTPLKTTEKPTNQKVEEDEGLVKILTIKEAYDFEFDMKGKTHKVGECTNEQLFWLRNNAKDKLKEAVELVLTDKAFKEGITSD